MLVTLLCPNVIRVDCPVSVQLGGFVVNLTSDGFVTESSSTPESLPSRLDLCGKAAS
jgi:hypothetical protein